MIEIYHNPRCRKSREGLAILKKSGKEFKIIKYLDNVPSEASLAKIILLLGITPIQLIRKTEQIWKDNYKGKDLSDAEIIKVLLENPKLIERPIVINNNKAVIGRPSENIIAII